MLATTLLGLSSLLGLAPHLPHDDVHAIAVAPLAGGGTEIVLATNKHSKFLRSVDDGLSWQTISGDGLDYQQGNSIAYWDHPTDPRYFLGTNGGVWVYRTGGAAVRINAGLLAGDRSVTDISTSRNGDGPVLLATANGSVYAWQEGSASWTRVLKTATADPHAQVAVAPLFDPNAGPGPDQAVFAAIAGRLLLSQDGGQQWSIHSQFAQAATAPGDWWISSIALATNYHFSREVLIGRARDDAAAATGTAGEVWRSDDYGQSFSLAATAGSAVRALTATPPAPAGAQRRYLAALAAFPFSKHHGPQPGVLLSADGLSWGDLGNAQDFALEDEDGTGVEGELAQVLDLQCSPSFSTDGTAFLARPSGLYRSRDAGRSWQQVNFRSPSHVRGMDLAVDQNGELQAFCASYGSGLVKVNLDLAATELLDGPLHYNRSAAASANFAADGAVGLAGEGGVALWFDTSRPPANLGGRSGFAYTRTYPNARVIEFHPRFDLSGTVAGGLQTLVWGFQTPALTYLSHNGGLSSYEVSTLSTGAPAPDFRRMQIAPTYDPSSAAGRTDIYGLAGVRLMKLSNDGWASVAEVGDSLFSIELDPDFSRPGNPRIYIAELKAPLVHEVVDEPGNVRLTTLPSAGLAGQIRTLALAPDFAARPVIYAATWGTGIVKLDLASPAPVWDEVGAPFPAVWTEMVKLSPDFANDRRVIVGTQYGVYVGQDLPGAPWVAMPAPYTLEDNASGLRYYDPGAPANRQPERVWPWPWTSRWDSAPLQGLEVIGQGVTWTASDGAFMEWECRTRKVRLRTFRGAGMGQVKLELLSLATGLPLGSVTAELLSGGPLETWDVALEIGQAAPVIVRATATLDPGERLVVDGLTVHPE